MENFRTCRVCKKQDQEKRLFKYDVRHYAHYHCLLSSRFQTKDEVVAWLESLHAHEIRNFPVLVLSDWLRAHGMKTLNTLDLLKGILEKAEKREGLPALDGGTYAGK